MRKALRARGLPAPLPAAALVLVACCAGAAGAQETAPDACAVTIRAESEAVVSAIEVAVGYAGAAGDFDGEGPAVACEPLADGVLSAANDDDGGRTLSLGLLSAGGLVLPADAWVCRFVVADGIPPTADDFDVSVIDALDASMDEVEASAFVSGIDCDSATTCGNGVIEGDEECDDGGASGTCDASCRLDPTLEACTVAFEVRADRFLGGLQFGVEYAGAPGVFDAEGLSVACSTSLDQVYAAKKDDDEASRLDLAWLAPTGVTPPVEAWQCRFLATSRPTSGGFDVVDLEATDLSAGAIAARVSVVVRDCRHGPVCGDGVAEAAEECDDANSVATDSCTNTCANARCGDGITGPGEECDDANSVATDSCTNTCANARCGDGITGPGEQCDDANSVATDSCTNACANARCGDGIVGPGEECDEGDIVPGDGCSATCQEEAVCGDADGNGAVQAADALRILRASVGQPVACPAQTCDVDGNGAIGAADALRVLRKSVGQNVALPCASGA